MNTVVALTVTVPLLAAALLAAVGGLLGRVACDAVALVASAATAVLCLVLLVDTGSGLRVAWFGGWHPRGGVAIGIDFAVDAFGAGLAAFVAVLMTLAMVYTWRPVRGHHPHFQALMLIFLAGMVGFAESGDLFNMFVFFELMSVSAIALVGYKTEEREAVEGALNFAVTNTLGSFVFLLGIGLLYGRTGTLNLAQIGEVLARRPPDELVVVALGLLVAGFLVKAAAVPFHFWLADAYAVAPASVCLLLAGAMSEMGVFGIGRVYYTCFAEVLGPHAATVRAILIGVGILTALWGAALALAQDHVKRMLAFVTISMVGVYLAALGLLSAAGVGAAALYVLADGFLKACAFGCVGIIEHRRARLGQQSLHGALRDMPWTGAVFLGAGLLMAGLPVFGPFLAKSAVEDAAIHSGHGIVAIATVAAVGLNAAAVLRAGARMFLGWGHRAEEAEPQETDPDTESDHERTPATMFVPTALLLLAGAALGVWYGFADLAERGAHRFTDQAAYAAQVLHGRAVPVGHAASHTPEWFDYLLGTGTVLLALLVAAWDLWWRAGDGVLGAVARAAAAALRPVERLHSGHVGDYVTWFVVGTGGVTVLLSLAR